MKGIFRWVRIRLDPDASKELREETQDALDKGTDPRKPRENLGRVERSLEGLRRVALRVAGVVAGIFAVRQIGRFVRESVAAGRELARSRRTLELAVRNEGIAWEEVEGHLRAYQRTLWETHRLTEGEVNPILQRLLQITGDYGRSLENVGLVADVAAGLNMDMGRAAQYVGRILNGDVNVLRRYGVEIAEGANAAEVLRERFSGMARENTDATEVLTKVWGDFKEALGLALLGAQELDEGMGELAERIQSLTGWLEDNTEAVGRLTSAFIRAGAIILRVVAEIARAGLLIVGTVDHIARTIPRRLRSAMATGAEVLLEGFNTIRSLLARVGINVGDAFAEGFEESIKRSRRQAEDEMLILRREYERSVGLINSLFRGGTGRPGAPDPGPTPQGGRGRAGDGESPAELQISETERLIQRLAEERDALKHSEVEIMRRSEAYRQATPEQRRMIEALMQEKILLEGTAEAERQARREKEAREAETRRLVDSVVEEAAAMGKTREEAVRLTDAYLNATDAQRELIDQSLRKIRIHEEEERAARELATRQEATARAMTSSMTRFFEATAMGFSGSVDLMQAWRESAAGVGAAVVESLTEGKVEYHTAQGIAKLAEGTWPPNPAALAASAQHFAAAAAFQAIPGALRAAGRGGRGVGATMGSTGAAGRFTGFDQQGREVNIFIDPLDPANPVVQDFVGASLGGFSERSGVNVNVRANPRGRRR